MFSRQKILVCSAISAALCMVGFGAAHGADTGWKSPTGYSNLSGGYEGTPADAYTSNDIWWGTHPNTVGSVWYANFAFGIPNGAAINGIEVQGECRKDGAWGGVPKFYIKLSWNTGASWTTEKTTDVTETTDVFKTHGGPADLWGRTWSSSEFSDATFRCYCSDNNSSDAVLRLDHIKVKVYYTEPSTPTPTITPTQTPTNTPTTTPTNTPTVTPTQTPTNTPTSTPTNTPDSVPPDAPVITDITSDSSGRIKSISGTAETDSTVHLFIDGVEHTFSAGEAGAWTYTETLSSDSHTIHAYAVDQAQPPNQSPNSDTYMGTGFYLNVFQDTSTFHSGATSIKLVKDTSYDFKFAVNEGGPVTVKAWLTKNSSYTGTAPTITLTGPGINGTGDATASLTETLPNWQQLTVSGTPGTKGVVTLKVETFSTAAGANAWIDDITLAQE